MEKLREQANHWLNLIESFGSDMFLQMYKNRDKPGKWLDDSYSDLLDRLKEETAELEQCFSKGAQMQGENVYLLKVITEAADVANFAMMIADKARHGYKIEEDDF